MKLRYFKEIESGDYGAVVSVADLMGFWGRATCIRNDPASMSTTRLGVNFLRENARLVPKSKVPKKWLRAIAGGK